MLFDAIPTLCQAIKRELDSHDVILKERGAPALGSGMVSLDDKQTQYVKYMNITNKEGFTGVSKAL
jgi:hypothetical protein